MLGVFLGLILARSRFGEITALLVSLLYGIVANILFAALNQSLSFRDALISVLLRSYDWGIDLVSGGINTDPLVLTLLVGIVVLVPCIQRQLAYFQDRSRMACGLAAGLDLAGQYGFHRQ